MKQLCTYCGYENIIGIDHCVKCFAIFTPKDAAKNAGGKLQKKIMTERVADFISKVAPIIVTPDTSIQEVIERMQALPTKGCVLICENNGKNLVGIASIRDILFKVPGLINDPKKTPISKIMTSKPESLDKDAPLSFALNKMSIGKFRHVPVLDKGVPIGVVSTRDLIEYLTTENK